MYFNSAVAGVAILAASVFASAEPQQHQGQGTNNRNDFANFNWNGGKSPQNTAQNHQTTNQAVDKFAIPTNFPNNFGGANGQNNNNNRPTSIPNFGQGAFTNFGQGARPTNFPVPSNNGGGKGGCPAVWTQISRDLTGLFSDNGQCNDLARAAIRISFHDCGSWKQDLGTSAGCDGSIYLAKEYTRSENAGMQDTIPQLGAMAAKYGVGVADFLQFAGAHAVVTCPLGPTVQTFVGRKDRSEANPEGLLPNPRSSGDALAQNMADKGFTSVDTAALIGAHTSAKQFIADPSRAGAALDTTPGIWDVKFYSQVLDGSAPFILAPDRALANQKDVGPIFKRFVNDQSGWNKEYAPAMTKMSLLGVDRNGLIDCTSALPKPRFNTRREVIGHIAPWLLVSK